MNVQQEVWCQILGFPKYEVSSHGKVRNIKTGKLLKPRYKFSRKKTRIQAVSYVLTGQISVSIHRIMYQTFIGIIPDSMVIDHIDRDPTNNTLTNLRLLNHTENCRNSTYSRGTSKYRGVTGVPYGRWRSTIVCNRKKIELGCFGTELEAAMAYDKAIIDLGLTTAVPNLQFTEEV